MRVVILVLSILWPPSSGCDELSTLPSEIEPQFPVATIHSNGLTPEVSITPSSTSTPVLDIPTTTPLSTEVYTLTALQLYASLPTVFNFRDALGVSFITDFRFVDEALLAFEGWTPSEAITATIAINDTEPSDTFGLGSFSINLKAGELDLMSGDFSTRTLKFPPLLDNPCQGQCAIEIWGQSPDEQWQIVQVGTGMPEEIGIWLVSQNDKIQLVPYVPPDSNWQWAVDSSLLWYTFYDRDYGIYADAISLNSQLSINFENRDAKDPMNPLTHSIAFSPQEKMLLSTSLRQDSHELYTIDLTQNSPALISTQIITGLIAVRWNEPTQSYFLEIAREEGLEFREMQGMSIIIPIEVVYIMYPSVEKGLISIQDISPNGSFSVSPAGKYLAIVYAHGEIKIFSTSEK